MISELTAAERESLIDKTAVKLAARLYQSIERAWFYGIDNPCFASERQFMEMIARAAGERLAAAGGESLMLKEV